MCSSDLRRRALDHAAKEIGANVIATGHNLDDTLQTFLINTLSGDTSKIGWMNPENEGKELRKIKPLSEIYESEIVFYAFTNNLPFQSEPCPHMNEGIRTEIREFLNTLEDHRSGIKNNMYHRSEEHTSELQSLVNLVCRLLLEKKKTRYECSTHRYTTH